MNPLLHYLDHGAAEADVTVTSAAQVAATRVSWADGLARTIDYLKNTERFD